MRRKQFGIFATDSGGVETLIEGGFFEREAAEIVLDEDRDEILSSGFSNVEVREQNREVKNVALR